MNIQTILQSMQVQLQTFHWQTTSYAQHIAFGDAYTALQPLVDSFMESYIGITDKRPKAESIQLVDLQEGNPKSWCTKKIGALRKIRDAMERYPELVNICDEIIALLSKLSYLLTLD